MPLVVGDVIGWLNDVTGGNLLLWKVVVATVVFALAGTQVVLAARFWGVATIPVSPGGAVKLHRYGGRLTVFLAVLVAFTCLVGPAGPTSPTRVLLHSIFGRPRLRAPGGQVHGAAGGEEGRQVPAPHRLGAVPHIRCDLGDQRR